MRCSRASSAGGSSAFGSPAHSSSVPSIRRSITRTARQVVALRRLGKRLVWELEDDLFLVIHLMIAGRFKLRSTAARRFPARSVWRHSTFENGSLILTEAGSKRRASLYLVRGEQELAAHDPGGLEVLTSTRRGSSATR